MFRALLVAAGLMLSAGGGWAASAQVLGIRYSAAIGHTRLVFDLDRPAAATPQSLTTPDRLLVDIEAAPVESLTAMTIDSDLVARVRFGPIEGGRTRFVVDLKQGSDYRLIPVPAGDGKPDRLVVDLFGMPGASPSAAKRDGPPPASASRGKGRKQSTPNVAPRTVVVDAGHGGQDPGASGFDREEKAICLAVAEQVVRELNRRPGFKASLTRSDDRFIPLRGRSAIAEKRGADAFISIHANASRDPAARGTEVYFLSLSGATDEAARELAREENAADARGGLTPAPEDDLSSIMFDMQQTEVLHRGSLLAQSVVEQLVGWGRIAARGVKQAGFVVLKSPRIPSILVETAFITNETESRLLASPSFQRELARRVAAGVVDYFANVSVADARPGSEE